MLVLMLPWSGSNFLYSAAAGSLYVVVGVIRRQLLGKQLLHTRFMVGVDVDALM